MALDATLGSETANCYVTQAEATAYFSDRMYASAWTALVSKDPLLITASQMLDWYVNWKGYKTSEEQAMQWPREEVIRPDGTEIDNDVLPSEVKIAVYELAFSNMESDRTLDDPLAGIGELKVSSLMIKAGPSPPKQTNKKIIPIHIYKILSDLYNQGSSMSVVRLLRA